MAISIVLGGEKHIELGAIEYGPEDGLPFITALGLAYLNWGRMEQTLEFLLRYTDDPRLATGAVPKFPDTSFRFKVKLFKKLYVKHPRFSQFHEAAESIVVGLKKANESRVRVVHCNFQGFDPGPPQAMKAVIVKYKGSDLQTLDGTWTFQALQEFNQLLCFLNNDLAAITAKVITPEFLQSLERPLSQTERAILAIRRILSRLPRLRIERPFPLA
ncbi:MAG: hypothetical protein J0I29_16100 [Rhizobiales bacterium]|nr:hypothetical protein [Hyphomicrobiales bacterium]